MAVSTAQARRTPGEMAGALVSAALVAAVSLTAWNLLPHPGANGRLILGLVIAVCAYRLTNSGDGRRNLSLRTLAWTVPVLAVQIALQLMVANGVMTWG